MKAVWLNTSEVCDKHRKLSNIGGNFILNISQSFRLFFLCQKWLVMASVKLEVLLNIRDLSIEQLLEVYKEMGLPTIAAAKRSVKLHMLKGLM